jgi:23S rRNA pseudouridine955/2504/2580 synthase
MNQVRFVEVSEEYAGQRLDNFLQRELKGVPKTRIYRALRKGEVRVNKGRVKADYRVKTGDVVRLPPVHVAEPQEGLKQVPQRWARLLEGGLLYEDRGLWVLNKPSGLAVHGGSGLNFGMIECLRLLRPEERYLELVHRLDRDTSGCIMIARRGAALKDLHRQLREDRVSKRYLALVQGQWSAKRNHVDAPLNKNTLKSGERIVRVGQGGKHARTDFRVIERFADCSLVEARPITGRTHQIRVHALHAGHPLLGDEKYGDKEANQWARRLGLKRLFLHASRLGFTDLDGKRQEVKASLETSLKNFLEKLPK